MCVTCAQRSSRWVSASVKDLSQPIKMTYVIYPIKSYILFCVGLSLFVYVSSDVAHYETFDRAIKSRA